MICVIQRAVSAAVTVDGSTVGSCSGGDLMAGVLLVLAGIKAGDTPETVRKMAEKTAAMRIFEDENGKLGLSVRDIGGSVLAVPNFTLCSSCRRGTRPDFTMAEKPERARELFDRYVGSLRETGITVETGVFGADMAVSCRLDGPVTIVLDSEKDLPAL